MCVNSYLHGKNYDRLSISCLDFKIFRELVKVAKTPLVHMNAYALMVTTVSVSYYRDACTVPALLFRSGYG